MPPRLIITKTVKYLLILGILIAKLKKRKEQKQIKGNL